MVDKFVGDCIMAVFGAPVALEDDAERALRAALAMRERLFPEKPEALRLVNSEGDALSGLVVDRYGEVLVVQVLSFGLEAQKTFLIEQLKELTQCRAVVCGSAIARTERRPWGSASSARWPRRPSWAPCCTAAIPGPSPLGRSYGLVTVPASH
jgi:23S rRNA G2069 N7-methylase RlmK/C1962 C5-methylase RlmI